MQKFKLKDYAVGTSERAVVEMFLDWAKSDIRLLRKRATITWQSTARKQYEYLSNYLQPFTPANAFIESVTPVSKNFCRVAVRADWRICHPLIANGIRKIVKITVKNHRIEFNMIRESASRIPSRNGTWGFNPPSIYNLYKY